MNTTNRLGCLTGTGFVAALITLFVLVGVAFASGSQMFSAGELNAQPGETMGGVTSHADIKECKTCHSAPWERATMADRCLECHTEIASQMLNTAELHGSIVQKSPSIACRDCHQDHRGANAELTNLGENVFPHEALGFSLNEHQRKESGAPITCDDCHGEDVTTFVSDSCQTCHSEMDVAFAQAHLLSFGSDCIACHDGVDRFDDFNHNAYPFKLEGGHANVACTECHLDARSIADMQSAPQSCYSCHYQDDEHNGDYGRECENCHNPPIGKMRNLTMNVLLFQIVVLPVTLNHRSTPANLVQIVQAVIPQRHGNPHPIMVHIHSRSSMVTEMVAVKPVIPTVSQPILAMAVMNITRLILRQNI
ncbi:MAG: hypothetical protein IPJ47_09200 [Anaerolineales bacterium]|nr:hypothetical protein [Anaerolineales bacterium]